MDRRNFLHHSATTMLAGAYVNGLSRADSDWTAEPAVKPDVASAAVRAIAFDAFPIFDPRPVFALAETLFPGKGAELSNAWRTRQFEYQWLRTAAGKYADFLHTTEEGLVFAAKQLQLDLTADKRAQLMLAYMQLKAWPDVADALNTLKAGGVRLALLSNMTDAMLHTSISNSSLDGVFEHVLSTDRIKTYKPDPRAYQLGMDAFKLKREEIAFAAYAGWDAAGAKWFGYPTVWVNRAAAPVEELGVTPDAMGKDMSVVTAFMKAAN